MNANYRGHVATVRGRRETERKRICGERRLWADSLPASKKEAGIRWTSAYPDLFCFCRFCFCRLFRSRRRQDADRFTA
ncbi:hypothetical protein CDO73_12055 [Saccharibacillus sp. O23]|nr:hypothetical protein CDO73_12055 [Saccharibacillus sp. O23]